MASANLFTQYLQAPRSVMDYAAELDQADARKNALAQSALGLQSDRMKIDAARQAGLQQQAKMNALQRVFSQYTDPLERARALQADPLTAAEGVAAEKALIDAEHVRATTRQATAAADEAQARIPMIAADIAGKNATTKKTEVETAGLTQKQQYERMDRHVQDLANVNDVPAALQWLSEGVSSGQLPFAKASQISVRLQSDPAFFATWKQGALMGGLSALEQVKALADAEVRAETNRSNVARETETKRNNEAQVGATIRGQDVSAATQRRGQDISASTTIRGQNMADARAREQIAAANAAGKPLTEGQSKALLFGSRMQESNKVLAELAASGAELPSIMKQGAESVPLIGGALGMAANVIASPKQQQVEQAQRDFVNAALRRESGASISPAEFDNARKQYFPQPGDSEAVKAQKARNRELAIQGMLYEVPEQHRTAISTPAPAAPAAPTASRVGNPGAGWSIKAVQ